jgi:cobalamin biosynthesis Mg chelatase CobN
MQNSSACGQNNTATQNVSMSDIQAGEGCSLNLSSVQSINQIPTFTCLSDSSQSAKLQRDLITQLEQSARASTVGVGTSVNATTDTAVLNRMVNDLSSNVNISNIATCLQNNLATQNAVSDTIKGSCPSICKNENVTFNEYFTPESFAKLCTTSISSAQELVQAAVASCVSSNTALTDSIESVANEIQQTGEASTKGTDVAEVIDTTLSGVAGITSAATMPFLIAAIVAIVFIIGFVIFSLSPAGQEAAATLSSKV